jgi:hypothetical protein
MECRNAPLRIATILALAMTAAACGGTASPVAAPARETRMTAADLQREIDAELPPGTSLAQVTAWLAARGIEHSPPVDQRKQAHMGANPDEILVSAILRDVARRPLVTTSLAISFRFDRSERLKSAEVETVRTGL